jgi:hypothetical protein
MSVASFAESITVFTELAVPQRSEHLGDGLLDHAIQHRRNAEGTLRPIRLGNKDPAHRRGVIDSFPELGCNALPVFAEEFRKIANGHAVDARCPFVSFDAFPRHFHIHGIENAFHPFIYINLSHPMLSSTVGGYDPSPSGVFGSHPLRRVG